MRRLPSEAYSRKAPRPEIFAEVGGGAVCGESRKHGSAGGQGILRDRLPYPAFDALALLAAGVPRVVAIFGVQGWRWDWVREVRELVFALDADAAGQQQWRQLARQAALRGKRVAVLPAAAYGGCKDVSEAWEERVAIMTADGHPSH